MINEYDNKAKDRSAVYWLTLLFQECPWLHAHEDSSDEWGSLHPRPVQQPFLLHTRDDPALLPQQAAHQGRRTHVPALPRHRPAPLTVSFSFTWTKHGRMYFCDKVVVFQTTLLLLWWDHVWKTKPRVSTFRGVVMFFTSLWYRPLRKLQCQWTFF